MVTSGLTTAAAQHYHQLHGYNEIEEKRESLAHKIIRRSASPVSAMLLFAAVLSFVSGKIFDGCFILFLLVLNIGVTVWQEYKADTAIQKLNEGLATTVRALRDGEWETLSARLLVPGDLVELRAGDIVPADACAESVNGASANEAALTGESLPKEKNAGDTFYSGSFLTSGLATVRVTATGSATSFGKTIVAVDTTPHKSALEKDVLRISKFLSIVAVVAVLLLTAVSVYRDVAWADILRLDLSLAIAGVPISLPAVMTLIIALGVVELSKKGAIVRRLSALEELANTDLLLTDKTGTLTKNHIIVNEAKPYGAWNEEVVRGMAAFAAAADPDTAISQAFFKSDAHPDVVRYVPADSVRKRSTLTYREENHTHTISLGAPQTIAALCRMPLVAEKQFYDDVGALAVRGYRAIALAVAEGGKETSMTLAGLFALSDELREDAGDVVQFLGENGIEVVMVTGDNRAIAQEIAEKLKIKDGTVVARGTLLAGGIDALTATSFRETRAFAEILPEDKYALVVQAKRFFTVATNGDGVNDLPALKAANVSFAVKDAVGALKGAADIVLVSNGIAVMKDAFIEGRKIFERLYTYSLYRISESFRLIATIVVLGLLTGTYPLSPLQLILLALLNDIPIISLATDRVNITNRPSKINVRRQFAQSLLYGTVGIANSVLLFFLAVNYLHLSLPVVETLFFLKLTVSGHLLIYVAHTKQRWWRYLPSRTVIVATASTQVIATVLAITGFLMPAPISWSLVAFVWIWSFFWMQVSELVKRQRDSKVFVTTASAQPDTDSH